MMEQHQNESFVCKTGVRKGTLLLSVALGYK